MAKNSLEIKRKTLERYTDKSLYPYTKYYLRKVHERFGTFWENHFSTIGIIGANEAALNLLDTDIGTTKGQQFALEILQYIRTQLQNFQQETGNHYNLEATPAEGTGFRLAQLDQKRFPEMVVGMKTDTNNVPIYTNSTQLPVNYSSDIYEVLDLQNELQAQYTGGTVQHVFLGEAEPNPTAVKLFIKSVCENYQIPYFTISPSFSICPNHGYLNGEVESCPTCRQPTEIYSRVVGYMRPVKQWNEGKRAEFAKRSHYQVEDKP